jgi:hypothetical protein
MNGHLTPKASVTKCAVTSVAPNQMLRIRCLAHRSNFLKFFWFSEIRQGNRIYHPRDLFIVTLRLETKSLIRRGLAIRVRFYR